MFIVFCGINGCGKSVQAEMLCSHMRSSGRACEIVKAYDQSAKERLGELIELGDNEIMSTFLILALLARQYADTAQLLADKQVVIADRWDESFLAHHSRFGFLSQLPKLREMLVEVIFRNLKPDIGFVLQLPVEVAQRRMSARGTERFRGRDSAYYETIQTAYIDIARERGWTVLDGSWSVDEIHKEIVSAIISSCD